MKLTILGVAAFIGAIGVSRFTSSPTQQSASMFEAVNTMERPDAFTEPSVDISFEGTLENLLGRLNEIIGTYDLSPPKLVRARWSELRDAEVTPQSIVTLSLTDVSIEECLDVIAQDLSQLDEVDWWYGEGAIELAPKGWIDQQQMTLVSYPVTDVIESIMRAYKGIAPAPTVGQAAPPDGFRINADELMLPPPAPSVNAGAASVGGGAGGVTTMSERLYPKRTDYDRAVSELTELLTSMVSPSDWLNNGGATAQLQILGGKMFVEAPQPMQMKVEWILNELRNAHDVTITRNETPTPSPQQNDMRASMERLRGIGMHIAPDEIEVTNLPSPFGPVGDSGDYWVLGDAGEAGKLPNPSTRVVAFDRAMYDRGGEVAVLFADGHVELLPREQFDALALREENVAVAAELTRK